MSTPILKNLKAEPGDEPDMSTYEPVGLEGAAREVWDYFAHNTPFWWSAHDLVTVERYCYLIGVERRVRDRMNLAHQSGEFKVYQDGWSIMKSLSLELKNVEYSLGVTPQGRAALKLAMPANQGEREEQDRSGAEPMGVDDL